MFSLKYNHLKLRIMCFLKLWMSPSYLQERLLFMEFHEQPCFYRLNTGSREPSLFYIIWLTWKGRETICSLITRDWILHTAPLRIDPCSRTQSHSYLLSLYCDTWYGLMWSTPSLVRTQMSMLLPEARSFMTPAWMAARTSSFALSSWELQEFREKTERNSSNTSFYILSSNSDINKCFFKTFSILSWLSILVAVCNNSCPGGVPPGRVCTRPLESPEQPDPQSLQEETDMWSERESIE